ncbi:uncharacterized protein BDV17DRAFT_291158 [Aspergillus undulatus]|uniref:uncharacterized protein n=1 Tax=Aspergillus undulatus TaxID=1810928 RepID=UPI003CCDDE2C
MVDLGRHYRLMRNLALGWTLDYVISGVSVLPEYQTRRLISRADGFCAQMDWAELKPLLPPTVAGHFRETLGELLIYLTVHEQFFDRPFWYLDGKKGPDDQGEDPEFADRLQYLIERFYKTNPTSGVWKMQTQHLANSTTPHHAKDPEFGMHNAQRHEAAIADDLLACVPFCWLLKDSYPSTCPQAQTRREALIDVLRQALRTPINRETWTDGRPILRGTRGVWRGCGRQLEESKCPPVFLAAAGGAGPGPANFCVARPGLVYVDSFPFHEFGRSLKVREVCAADVIPLYAPADDEERNKKKRTKKNRVMRRRNESREQQLR